MRLEDVMALAPYQVGTHEVQAFLSSDPLYCARCRAFAGSRTVEWADIDRNDMGAVLVRCDDCLAWIASVAFRYWRPLRAQA